MNKEEEFAHNLKAISEMLGNFSKLFTRVQRDIAGYLLGRVALVEVTADLKGLEKILKTSPEGTQQAIEAYTLIKV